MFVGRKNILAHRLAAIMVLVVPLSLHAQEISVRDKGVLSIADLRFDNFLGVVSPKLEVKSGDEAGMKFFVEGFSRQEQKDDSGRPEYRVQLSYSIDITDPEGKSVQPTTTGKVETRIGVQDEVWRAGVEWSVRIPETAPSGAYPIRVHLVDEIGNQSVEHTATLRVRGTSLKTSGQFEIVQVEFAPTDNGPWRPIWYFDSGSPVFVRYKVVGYTVSPDKEIRVEQDWALLDEEGKEVIRQPAAMVEESRAYYPPRFIQSYFSLSLRDPRPGPYRIRIDARDTVGDQACSAEARFVLRP
jgi:hypothetical protein